MLQPKKGSKRNTVAASQYDSQFEWPAPSFETLKLDQKSEGDFGGVSTKKYDEFKKAGVDYVPGMDIQEQLAVNQSRGQQIWRVLKRGGVGAVAAAIEPFAYLLDFEHHLNTLNGVEQDYDNWLAKGLRDMEDYMRETSPIYTRTEHPDIMSAEWFAKNGDQMIRSIGYLAPGAGFFKAGTMASRFALGKTANLLGKSVTGLKTAENIGGAVSSAMALNYGEHAVSAVKHMEDQLPRLMEHYIKQGMDPGQAEERARQEVYEQASDIVWGGKVNILWQSISQLNLFRGISHTRAAGRINTSAKAPIMRDMANKLAIEMPTEAMEEITTGYLESEARNKVDRELGLRLEDYRPSFMKWADHASTYEGITEGLTGAFGAGPITITTSIMQKQQRINAIEQVKNTEAALGIDGKRLKDLTEDQFYSHAILNAYKGTYENFMEMLEGYKNMSAEEAAQLGVEENYKEIADQYLADAKAIEDVFNEIITDPVSKNPGVLEILINNRVNKHRNENRIRRYKQDLEELKAKKVQLNEEVANNPEETGLHYLKDLELTIEAYKNAIETYKQDIIDFKKIKEDSPLLESLESNERLEDLKKSLKALEEGLVEQEKSFQNQLESEALLKNISTEEILKSIESLESFTELDRDISIAEQKLALARSRRKTASESYEVYMKNPERLKKDGEKRDKENQEKAAKKKAAEEKTKSDEETSLKSKIVNKAKQAAAKIKSTVSPEKESDILAKIKATSTLEELESLKTQLEADKKTSPAIYEELDKRKTVISFNTTPNVNPDGSISEGEASGEKESVKSNQLSLEYERFVDTGEVSDETLIRIATNIKNNQPLTKEEEDMQQAKAADVEAILRGMTPAPKTQEQTLKTLDTISDMVSLVEDEETGATYYQVELPSGPVRAERTSQAIDKAYPNDKFTGEGFELNTEWGNLVDRAIEAVINKLPKFSKRKGFKKTMKEEATKAIEAYRNSGQMLTDANITEEALDSVLEGLYNLMEANPKAEFRAQVMSFNVVDNRTVAGALDIVMVQPNGKATIIDVKTSVNSTKLKAYSEGDSGRTSKKVKHSRQQSLYSYYLEQHGIEVQGTYILPFFIQDDQQYIAGATTEALINLPYSKSTIDKVFTKNVSPEAHLSPELDGDISNEGASQEELSMVNNYHSDQIPSSNIEVFDKQGDGKSQQLKSSQSAGFVSVEWNPLEIEVEDGRTITIKVSDSNKINENAKNVHSVRHLREGAPVQMVLVDSNGKEVAQDELRNMSDEQIESLGVQVKAIIGGTPQTVTALHSVEWVTENNSPETVEKEIQKAKDIRKHIASLEGSPLQSKVVFKGSGLFLRLFEEDSNGKLIVRNNKLIPKNVPVKEAIPDWNNIEIGVVKNGEIKVKGATTNKTLSSNIMIEDGRVVALLPTPNGTFFPAILWADNVSETQADTVIGAAIAFITNDTQTFDLIREKTGIDIGRDGAKGALNAFINRYVYASPYSYKYEAEREVRGQGKVLVYSSDKQAGKLQIVDVDNRTIYTNDPAYYFKGEPEVSEDGTYTGDLKEEHVENEILVIKSLNYRASAMEASSLLQNKLISADSKRLNREGNFVDIELSLNGEVVLNESGAPKTSTHPSYNAFKLNSLQTDINGQNKITHPDGSVEYTYMTQPTVLFDFSAIEEEDLSEVNEEAIDDDGLVFGSLEFAEEEDLVKKTEEEERISSKMEEDILEGLIDSTRLPIELQDSFIQGILPLYAKHMIIHGKSFSQVSEAIKNRTKKTIDSYKAKGSYKLKAYEAILENFTRKQGKTTIESLVLEKLKDLDIIPTSEGFKAEALTDQEFSELLDMSSDFTQDAYDVEFYKADRKKTVSAEIKLFLASIRDPRNKNWAGDPIGLRYQEVYDTLKSLLTNVRGGFAEKVEALREASPSPVYKTILEEVEKLPLDFKHKFTIAMSGTEIGFVQALVDINDSNKTQVVNADNYSVIANTMEKWLNHLKNSSLVDVVNGETIINNKKVLDLHKEYSRIYAIAKAASKNKDSKNDLQSVAFLTKLQGILREIGIEVPIGGLKFLATADSTQRGKYINKGSWENNLNPNGRFFMANLFNSFQKSSDKLNSAMMFLEGKLEVEESLVKQVEELAKSIIEDPSERGLFYVNNPIEGENSEWVVRGLARLTVDYNGVIYGNTLRGADGKSIYPFQNAFGLQRLIDQYKADPYAEHNSLSNLLDLNISNGSIWGKNILEGNEDFSMEIKMFDATKFLKSSQIPKERKNQGEFNQNVTALVLYTNKGNETGYFLPITLADKDVTPLIKATKWKTVNKDTALSQMIIEDGNIVGIKDALMDVITEYAMGEYNRAYYHQTEGRQKAEEAGVNRGAYEEGANYFYRFDYLNSYNGENSEIWEKDGRTLKAGLDKNQVKEFIKSKVEAHIINYINENIQSYKDLQISDKYINRTYLNKVREQLSGKDRTDADLYAATIADMDLNNIISFNEQHILFGNDEAHAYKKNKGEFNLKATIKLSKNNYTKRKADLLSPRTSPEYSKKTVNIVTAGDSIKYIDGKEVERTDAQEYGTILEALEMKFSHGKIPEAIYNKLKNGIEAAIEDKNNVNNYYELSDFLDAKEIEMVEEIFVTDKPVHIANDINVELDSNSKFFRKSSTRWLWPSETRGLDLDELRIAMENTKTERLGHKSSDKTGAKNVATIYDKSGELLGRDELTKVLTESSRTLSRDGLGWQQEKPTNKKTVAQSTQMDVLAFEDMLQVELSSGKTVEALRKEKEAIVSEFYQEGMKALFKRMGIEIEDGVAVDMDVDKVAKFLESEATSRGWAKKDIAELKTRVVDEVTEGERVFRSPLMYNNARKNIDSLMLSIIRKEIANIKMPGYGYIQASNVGFRARGGMSWAEYKEALGKKEVREVITLTNPESTENYFDETMGLQGPRISSEGKVLGGQILVSPYFKLGGKTIDLTSKKYTKVDKTGKRYLQMDAVPKELLEMIGYRIPGQGKPSIMPLEVVGFLPKTSIATVIIPDEMIAQMGSDFDIDVLYTYRKHYGVDEDGVIKKKTDLSKMEELQDRYFEVMKELIFDPKFIEATQALDNEDLKSASTIVNNLTGKEYEITSSIYLRDNIKNNISQRTGKMLIGPSSLAATLYGALQGRNVKVSPDLEGNPVAFEFFETAAGKLELTNISKVGRSTGYLVNTERTSTDNNRSVQNAAVDNANEQVLADAGINNSTIDVALFSLAYKDNSGNSIHSEQLVYFLRQEAVELYTKHFDLWSSNAEGGYLSFEQIRDKAFDSAMFELESKLDSRAEMKDYHRMDLDEVRKDANGEFRTYSPQDFLDLFTATKDENYYLDQMAILAGFRKLQINGDPTKKLQRAIMSPRTKALRSTIFDADATLSVMEEVFSGELKGLSGVKEALEGTQFETLYETLKNSYEAFGKVMPFNIAAHRSLLDLYREDHNGSTPSPAVREHLFNALLENGYARAFENTFGENIEQYRLLSLFSEENSIAHELYRVQNTEWGKRNLFLQRLIPILKNDILTPNTISYTASKQEDVVDQMHKDLIALYQSDIKGHRELFEKIVKYAYSIGGARNARSFVQFIPAAYLEEIGFYKNLRAEERDAKANNVNIRKIYKEWIQHNPFYGTAISSEDLTTSQFLQDPIVTHSVPFNGKMEPYQIVLKPIDKAKYNLPYHKYTYTKDGVERYRDVLLIKKGATYQLYEKVVTPFGILKAGEGGVVFKRIPKKGKNTPKYRVSEYSGVANDVVGTIFSNNEVPTAPSASEEAVLGPDVPTQTPAQESKEEFTYSLQENEVRDREAARALLEEVRTKSANEGYRVLASVLLENFDTTGKDIRTLMEAKFFERDGEKIPAKGSYQSGTIKLNNDSKYLSKPETFEETILHEYLHAYLSKELENKDSQLFISIRRLRKASLAALKKQQKEVSGLGDALLEYALSSEHEFVSHALTHKGFQRFLNTVGTKKSVWNQLKTAVVRFIESIARAAGIQINKDSVLAETVDVVMEALSAETSAETTAKTAKSAVETMTTLEDLLGVIQEDGTFDIKYSLNFHRSKAYERMAKGHYTREQVEEAIEKTVEKKKRMSNPLGSIILAGKTNTTEQFINTISERINRLRNKLTSKNLSEVEGQKIRERIKTYERQRKSIRDDKTLNQVQSIAAQQFRWVNEVIANKNATNIEVQEALNIVDSYDYNVTSEFLDPKDLNRTNLWNNAILDLSRNASLAKAKLLDKLVEDITKEINTTLPDLRVTKQDLLEIPEEDFMLLKAYTQDLTKFKSPLVKLINRTLKNAARAKDRAVSKMFEHIDEEWNKVSSHPMVTADPHLFFQKDEEGKPSGYFVNRYSNSWRLDRNKIFSVYYKKLKMLDETPATSATAKELQKKSRIKLHSDLIKNLNNIEIAIDIRYWFNDSGQEQDTFLNSNFKNRDAYIEYLDKELGADVRKALVAKAQKSFEVYLEEKDANTAILMSDYNAGIEEREARIKSWITENSPIIALNSRYGKQRVTGRQHGHRKLVTAPRRTHKTSKKALNYYDSTFTAIENDPKLLAFYEYYTNTMKDLMKALPDNVVERLPENFWPAATRSFVEKLQQDGVFKTFKIFSGEGRLSYMTVEGKAKLDPTVTAKGVRSIETGEVIKNVPVRMIKGVDAQDKSYDISRVMKMFAAMSKNFEFKSEVEDRVLLLQRALREARELQLDVNGNPVKLSNKRDNLSIKGGLAMTREAVQYAVDASVYGETTDMASEKGVIINKKAIEIQDKVKALDEKFAEGNLDRSKYLEQRGKLEKEFEKIDPKKVSWKVALDSLIGYTQLRGMGYNITSGINNVGFGTIANLIHAAGNEDFSTQELLTAYAMVLKSSSSTSATKISKLVANYDILFDQLDTQYGTESRSKGKFRNIDPYMFQTKTEFVNQAVPLIAKMLATKVDDKGTSLFDAYDNEGNIREEFSDIAEEWSDNLDATSENKFSKFRDHIIELNKNNHGNYDPNSHILLKKSVIGRAVTVFRTWALEGFNLRMAAYDYNDQLQRHTKGRWRSYGTAGLKGSAIYMAKGLMNTITFGHAFSEESMNGTMEEIDYINMKKNLSELRLIISIYGAKMLLRSLAEDDEDNAEIYRYFANIFHRLEVDIFFYIRYKALSEIIKNPSAVLKTLGDVGKAIDASQKYLFDDDYQGDPLTKKWSKVIVGGSAYHSLIYTATEELDKD